jgi:hypothetical protein
VAETERLLDIPKLLAILAPIIVIQLILMITALIVCMKTEQTRGPKLMWVIVIIVANIVGPIAFLLFGRRNDG